MGLTRIRDSLKGPWRTLSDLLEIGDGGEDALLPLEGDGLVDQAAVDGLLHAPTLARLMHGRYKDCKQPINSSQKALDTENAIVGRLKYTSINVVLQGHHSAEDDVVVLS